MRAPIGTGLGSATYVQVRKSGAAEQAARGVRACRNWRRRNDHNNPTKIGADSASTSRVQTLHVVPSHIASQSSRGARARSRMAIAAKTSTGTARDHSPRSRPESGRASRDVTHIAAAESEAV